MDKVKAGLNVKRVLVIDGQGGGMGKMLIALLKKEDIQVEITAVGTNAIATTAMIKAGAERSATGENSVMFLSDKVDIIAGPMGIVMANAMLGEVTPKMAEAVTSSPAKKVLIPVSRCSTYITLSAQGTVNDHLADAVKKIRQLISE